MDREMEFLVEGIVYDAVRAFYDLDDKKMRDEYIKNYVADFCEEHNVDISEVIRKLKKMLNEPRYKDFDSVDFGDE